MLLPRARRQAAFDELRDVPAETTDGKTINLSVKVAVAVGPARRILVGEGTAHQIDVLAGSTLAVLADTEHQANKGEILIASTNVPNLEDKFVVSEWREEKNFAVVTGLMQDIQPSPWPVLSKEAISEAKGKSWLLPAVFEKVRMGKSDMLSELRQAAALFLKFSGIEYDTDANAGNKLNDFIQWVEQIIAPHKGSIIQLTVGDKGNYLYVVFGAPVAYPDDAPQAVAAALELAAPPNSIAYITDLQIGVTYGQMRVGAYGGTSQRTYGAIGDKTNLAARLMQAAAPSTGPNGEIITTILCNDSIHEAAQEQFEFEAIPPIQVKGKTQPIDIYRQVRKLVNKDKNASTMMGRTEERSLSIDRLPPAEQHTLKVDSVIGQVFSFDVLSTIYPEDEREHLSAYLQALVDQDMIVQRRTESKSYSFKDPYTHETAYNLMLFAQRRQLHRAIAEYLEQDESGKTQYEELANHWQAADDIPKAIHYLEKAGEQAQEMGDVEAARRFFNASLGLSS
jgi:class 3 adenylate cyclase